MATSLFKATAMVVLVHAWLAVAAGTAPDLPSVSACTSNFLDIFAGCSGAIGVVSALVLGTVTGAGIIGNAIIVFLQATYTTLVVAEWLRGRAA